MIHNHNLPGIPADALVESWDDVYRQTNELARQLEEHSTNTGEQFDRMLIMPRGSYYPANILAREFGFGATEILHAGISSYVDGSTERRAFRYGQMPTPEEVESKNILIVEEVCDSGNTLSCVVGLLGLAGAGLVRSAVLHYKPTASQTGYRPDFYVVETDKWIVYPWEVHEQNGKSSSVKRRQ